MGVTIQQGLNATNRVASTTDNAAARFDGTTGALQNSALNIDDTGHISSFGGNIKFPATQSASADANTLDDYEENTFTPTLSATGATFNYGIQAGVCTKIGNQVFFGITIQLAASGNTLTANPVTITGLPFTSNSTSPSSGFVLWSASTTSYIQVTWRILGSSSSVTLYGSTAASTGNITAVNADALLHATNQTFLVLSGSYRV